MGETNIQISLAPSFVLPPLGSKLTLGFESRKDLRYNAIKNIVKRINWQSPSPEVKSVSVNLHDDTLLKIRWSASGTRWVNNSLFYLKIETTSPNEKAESEVWHVHTTDNYVLSFHNMDRRNHCPFKSAIVYGSTNSANEIWRANRMGGTLRVEK